MRHDYTVECFHSTISIVNATSIPCTMSFQVLQNRPICDRINPNQLVVRSCQQSLPVHRMLKILYTMYPNSMFNRRQRLSIHIINDNLPIKQYRILISFCIPLHIKRFYPITVTLIKGKVPSPSLLALAFRPVIKFHSRKALSFPTLKAIFPVGWTHKPFTRPLCPFIVAIHSQSRVRQIHIVPSSEALRRCVRE